MVRWVRSTKCETSSCVEVAVHEDEVIVRESDRNFRPALFFTPQEWDDFIVGAKRGEFDRDRLTRLSDAE